MSRSGAIIALDCATVTGWAVARPSGHVAHGSWRLGIEGARDADVFLAFNNRLADLITVEQPAAIYYEAPIVGPMTARPGSLRLIGLVALVETIGALREVPFVRPAHMQSVRKHFIGQGSAPKGEVKGMVIAACRRRGWSPKDDNAADALACLDWAMHKMRAAGAWAGPLFGEAA